MPETNFTAIESESSVIPVEKDETNLSSASNSPLNNKVGKTSEKNNSSTSLNAIEDKTSTSINNETAHNLTNDLTSDSNNTNNITTSDVNLSGWIK